jgi:hypothetical protein
VAAVVFACLASAASVSPFARRSSPIRLDWIKKEGLSYTKAAKVLDISNASVVWKYAEGEIIPRPPVMQQIFERTGGEVTPADFHANAIARHRAEQRVKRTRKRRDAVRADEEPRDIAALSAAPADRTE